MAGNTAVMCAVRQWSIDARVRADEDSMFVRRDLLADAAPGDRVEVVSLEPSTTRSGRIVAEQVDPTRGPFWIVELDPP